MASNPQSEAIDRLTEVVSELLERMDVCLEHLTMHVHCVCRRKYGLDDPWGEDEYTPKPPTEQGEPDTPG